MFWRRFRRDEFSKKGIHVIICASCGLPLEAATFADERDRDKVITHYTFCRPCLLKRYGQMDSGRTLKDLGVG